MKSSPLNSKRRRVLCLCVWLLLAGCNHYVVSNDRPPVMLPYRKLIERYNRNLARLDRLWASTTIELEWREEGKKHFERVQGEGHLIIMLPDRVRSRDPMLALSVEKVGNTLYWAGCANQRYWMLDLRDQRVAYTGLHQHYDPTKTPLPVRPVDLPKLLGIVPFSTESRATVAWRDSRYVIEPPGMHCRLFLHPRSVLPTRIELLDNEGKQRISAELSGPKPVELTGVAPGEWPWLASRIALSVAHEDGRMTLHLNGVTDDSDLFNAKAFDFEHLKKAFKIEEVIDLDS